MRDATIIWCIAALKRANGGSAYIASQCDDALIELSGLKLMAQRFAGGSTSGETIVPVESLSTNAEKGVEYPAAAPAPVSSAAPTAETYDRCYTTAACILPNDHQGNCELAEAPSAVDVDCEQLIEDLWTALDIEDRIETWKLWLPILTRAMSQPGRKRA